MNDSLEDQLRQLRPGPLPARLRARLAAPPEAGAILRFPWRKWAAGLAAAACVALLAWPGRRDTPPVPVQFMLAEMPPGEVVSSRGLGVVTDGRQHAWNLTELERIDGQMLVADGSGMTVLTQRIRRELVPVEIHFD